MPAKPTRLVSLVWLSLSLLLTASPAVAPATASQGAAGAISVEIDGSKLALDQAPLLSNGVVLVPARDVFEALGASVSWDGISRRVDVTRGARTISLWIDSIGATVNGSRVVLDTPATVAGGRLMVPLQFVSQGLRIRVDWNESTRTAQITSPRADQVLRVGLITSRGSQALSPGDSLVKGFGLCLDELQQRMGNYRVQVFTADDGGDPARAAEAAARLITRDNVDVIVGSATSRSTIPISSVVQRYHVPLIAPGGTDPQVTSDYSGRKDYVFRAGIPYPYQGAMAAKFALQNLGARTAAVLCPYDYYGFDLAESFKKGFENGNGDILVYEMYEQDTEDFGWLLYEVATAGPDILYLPDSYDRAGVIARQARSMGIEATFLGGDGWDSGQLDFQGLDGGYFTTFFSAGDPHFELQSWINRYGRRYPTKPDATALHGYNAGLMLAAAIAAANSNDPIEIRNALAGLAGVQTPGGILTIDENGDAVVPVPIMQVKNGRVSFRALGYPREARAT